MKDYEQLYYDKILENRKLINEINKLKQEIQVYKEILGEKSLKSIICQSIINYKNNKKSN